MPESIDELLQNAVRHHQAGRITEAAALYRRALAIDQNHPDVLHLLGVVSSQSGDHAAAVESIGRAIAIKPDVPAFYDNLGNALQYLGRLEEAAAAYAHSLGLMPNSPTTLSNLGALQLRLAKPAETIKLCRNAIALRQDYSAAHFNLGLALLLSGELREGWAEFEWRWRHPGSGCIPRVFSKPMWDGSPLNGKTIFVHSEQGLGDTIQFIRYAKMLDEFGGRVILECHGLLATLVRRVEGVSAVIETGKVPPPFDVYCPIMSLPKLFGTELSTVPNQIPYISAKKAPSDSKTATRRIGLVWAGNPANPRDPARSIPASAFAMLADVTDVEWHSLQKGPAATQSKECALKLIDHDAELTDFDATASRIADLDLVISVDTAVAHLAGAMGKPVWTLLPFAPDWRWMLDRTDTPWYPTMKLFRQPRLGDWPAVIRQVKESLKS